MHFSGPRKGLGECVGGGGCFDLSGPLTGLFVVVPSLALLSLIISLTCGGGGGGWHTQGNEHFIER